MFKKVVFIAFIVILAYTCDSGSDTRAKKLQLSDSKEISLRKAFDPKITGFRCDSLQVLSIAIGNTIEKLIVKLGNQSLDTVSITTGKIPFGAEKDVVITDYNFDGFCEFVVPDKNSAARGGMDYYYFLFDTLSRNFIEIKSLPKFIGNFKLDVKNQRVKIYCPDDACFAYYKYENKAFKLVQGEFKP
jgi:hypothetical protein